MAIVIGNATTVSFENKCVISANWAYSPNTQRFYCIGEWVADRDRIYHKPTETLSLTIYAPGNTYALPPSTSCANASPELSATIVPAACSSTGETFSTLTGVWHISGYSYTKDDGGLPGQETWNLTKWQNLSSTEPDICTTTEPTFVMRGIVEGQGTLNAGLQFVTGTEVESQSGNVSANSFGRADIVQSGNVSAVGGGSSAAGETGQGSATIPLTAMYI